MMKEEEEIKIYTPTLVSENLLDVTDNDYNKTLFEGTDNGFIKMDVDKDVAIQRMSRDLYQYASSGIRELYANEARACRTAKKKYNADPMIVITIDQKKRKLVLEGIDSMGMTAHRFKKVFTVLGHSDNFDGTEVGQFGMGRAAYTCLSDTMILKTFARESGEMYSVIGRNGLGYHILKKPKMESYGTEIHLTLYGGIDYGKLYKMIEDVSRFSGIKTVLVLESELNYDGTTKDPGQYVMGPISVEERLEEMIGDSENIYKKIPICLEDDLIRIDGYLILKKNSWDDGVIQIDEYSTWNHTNEIYLVNVPITADEINIPLSYWILTIKDERILSPTPDRERLSEATIEKTKNAIAKLLYQQSTFNIQNMQEFHDSPYKSLYQIIARGNLSSFQGNLLETFDERTQDMIKLLGTSVWSSENKKKVQLVELLNYSTKIFHMEKLDKSKIAALKDQYSDCVIFRPVELLTHEVMSIFETFDVVSGEKFLEENKIDVTRITDKATECVEHYSEEGHKGYTTIPVLCSSRIPFSDVTSKTIRADSEFQTVRKIFQKIICSYRVVKNRKDIKSSGISFDEFVATIESKTYPTSKGYLHVSDIAATTAVTKKKKEQEQEPITLLQYPDHNLAGRLLDSTEDEELLVMSNADELFEIAVWLSHNNIKYVFAKNIVNYNKDYDLAKLINKYAITRNVSVTSDDYICYWYEHTDDIPKMLTLLDGILTINDDRALSLFMSATKKNQSSQYDTMQNSLDVMQNHLRTSLLISKDLKK